VTVMCNKRLLTYLLKAGMEAVCVEACIEPSQLIKHYSTETVSSPICHWCSQ